MKTGDVLLHTHELAVGYRSGKETHIIMEGLNCEVMTSRLICFMGPNGVGKSTLLRTLSGAQAPLAGDIFLKGKKIKELSKTSLASYISVVLTDPIHVGNITVRELISFGRYPYMGWNINFSSQDADAIDRAIDETHLTGIENRKIAELSDGQRQKVLIARALCQDTPLIILDEPTAHLDLNNRVEIINLLKQLTRKTKKAILMATHELDLALQTADELWLAGYDTGLEIGFPEDLVLSGKIDTVFQLKGFDLKTGHLEKKTDRRNVSVNGEGYLLLWTRNALERNGYSTRPGDDLEVSISTAEGLTRWNTTTGKTFETLETLIKYLDDL
ncbi:MAG: ABC transporter ATP-binding protein [Cytophagales bacterium]|nr:ABC transporter ATP-binding protein [Cytophagales bacterium]